MCVCVYIKSSYRVSLQKGVMEGKLHLIGIVKMESCSVTRNFRGFPQSTSRVPGKILAISEFGFLSFYIGGSLACRSLPLKLHSSLFLSGVFHVNCNSKSKQYVRLTLLCYSSESQIIFSTILFSIPHLGSN